MPSLKTFSLCASVRKVSRQSLNVSPNRFYSSWQLATHLSQSDWGRQIWKWSLLTLRCLLIFERCFFLPWEKKRRENSFSQIIQPIHFYNSTWVFSSLSPDNKLVYMHVCMYVFDGLVWSNQQTRFQFTTVFWFVMCVHSDGDT